jgi:ABC-2 type transport system ATP-binding protein
MDAIVIDGVSKSFRVSTEPSSSLKERLLRLARVRRTTYTEFQALRRLDLAVPIGQTVGILGHNGSGTSTLLKCIAGIITPSADD